MFKALALQQKAIEEKAAKEERQMFGRMSSMFASHAHSALVLDCSSVDQAPLSSTLSDSVCACALRLHKAHSEAGNGDLTVELGGLGHALGHDCHGPWSTLLRSLQLTGQYFLHSQLSQRIRMTLAWVWLAVKKEKCSDRPVGVLPRRPLGRRRWSLRCRRGTRCSPPPRLRARHCERKCVAKTRLAWPRTAAAARRLDAE